MGLGRLVGLDHAAGVLGVHRDRFFDEHMDALRQGIDADRRVVIVGRGNEDGRQLRTGLGQQLPVIIVGFDTILGRDRVGPGPVDVADGHQLGSGQFVDIPGVQAAHVAHTYDSHSQFFLVTHPAISYVIWLCL